jgi:hypothetical protein
VVTGLVEADTRIHAGIPLLGLGYNILKLWVFLTEEDTTPMLPKTPAAMLGEVHKKGVSFARTTGSFVQDLVAIRP